MHIVSRKDLNSAEQEPFRISTNSTTVIGAKEEVRTNEEATVYVCGCRFGEKCSFAHRQVADEMVQIE